MIKPSIKSLPQEPPKGVVWWCEQCEGVVAGDLVKPHDGNAGTFCHTVSSNACHIVKWREQPQPEKPDEPEGMERYIKMPCIFREGPREYNGILMLIDDEDEIACEEYLDENGNGWPECVPRPISKEVLRLREENDELGKVALSTHNKHESAKDEIEQLRAEKDHNWLKIKEQAACLELQTEEVSKLKAELESSTKTKSSLLREKVSLERELARYKKMEKVAKDKQQLCAVGHLEHHYITAILAALDTEGPT